jgi:2'-5' RNA ligase
VQTKCIEYDPNLSEMVVPVSLAHITVLVLYVEEERMEEAKNIIANIVKGSVIPQFDVRFDGLDNFNNNRIIFAKPSTGIEDLKNLNSLFNKSLTEGGFVCNDKSYNPHTTILKPGENVKHVPTEAFEEMKEKPFGIEKVSKIQLCLMGDKRNTDGYWECVGQWEFMSI